MKGKIKKLFSFLLVPCLALTATGCANASTDTTENTMPDDLPTKTIFTDTELIYAGQKHKGDVSVAYKVINSHYGSIAAGYVLSLGCGDYFTNGEFTIVLDGEQPQHVEECEHCFGK